MPPKQDCAAKAYAKRRDETERALRSALERLVKNMPAHPDLKDRKYRLTVATVAKEARIARSAIYANHPFIIEAIEKARAAKPKTLHSWQDKLEEQRSVIAQMKQDERRMITENASLLKRALDAEAEAAILKRRMAKLVAERDGAQETSVLTLLRPSKALIAE